MKIALAWKNVTHDKRRTMAALSGVVFAIVLVFMQLGFYGACRTSATLIYDALDFDAILVSPTYVHLRCCYTIPRARLEQARGVPGVASVAPLYLSTVLWRNLQTGARREVLTIGVNPEDRTFSDRQITDQLHLITRDDTALMDRNSRRFVGPHKVGDIGEANGRRIEVVGEYQRGTGLIADGNMVVNAMTLWQLAPVRPLSRPSMGLVRFDADADPDEVLRRLGEQLPKDTLVLSRETMRANEKSFFTYVKPVGLMFTFGTLVGFTVGAVILYQILSADIATHIPQYATLKAMGYGPGYLYSVVMKQGLLFGGMAYVPAMLISVGVYAVVRWMAEIPMYLTLERCVFVFAISVGMCVLSGMLAVFKVNAADPADLF